jgi:threonine dehydrogenase-like Zn-dependent dehydrogenase/predicted dehydrogenase
MKQIFQSLKTGEVELADIPCPQIARGQVLVATSRSLVSSGTEKMLIEFGKSNLLNKALSQPEKVKQVVEKIKTDGIHPTVKSVSNKLEQPMPLGYCNVGHVLAIGDDVDEFVVGDRVISNGYHAEVVRVPVNLCAKVPAIVDDEEASFAVLSSIALQGIRLASPTLGERFGVIGLGLVGLLAVQLLKAQGCRVVGFDFDENRVRIAKQLGAEAVNLNTVEDPQSFVKFFTKGIGLDGVLIAAATKSNSPTNLAADICRKRGRIILVGVTGLKLNRQKFYEKELTFQVSASYGPGRYDPAYEKKGVDYPVSLVRWTAKRNFEAVLDMMAEHKLNLQALISHRFNINDATDAYKVLQNKKDTLGIIISYNDRKNNPNIKAEQIFNCTREHAPKGLKRQSKVIVNFLGSGNHACSTLIPSFKRSGARLNAVASDTGVSGSFAMKKFGFSSSTTDPKLILEDSVANSVVISTRHDSHAEFVIGAIRNGKNVFVEKPLCLTLSELDDIQREYKTAIRNSSKSPIIHVGFNRRFSPHVIKMHQLLSGISHPKSFVFTVNAGKLDYNHWTQDKEKGGGRVIGEVCHFIDLLRFLTSSQILNFTLSKIDDRIKDTISLTLAFSDGSIGTIHYLTNGAKGYQKERLEVFTDGKILKLDNYRLLTGYGWKDFKSMRLWSQDKGHQNCANQFVASVIKGGQSPIPIEEIIEVSRLAIEISNEGGF